MKFRKIILKKDQCRPKRPALPRNIKVSFGLFGTLYMYISAEIVRTWCLFKSFKKSFCFNICFLDLQCQHCQPIGRYVQIELFFKFMYDLILFKALVFARIFPSYYWGPYFNYVSRFLHIFDQLSTFVSMFTKQALFTRLAFCPDLLTN